MDEITAVRLAAVTPQEGNVNFTFFEHALGLRSDGTRHIWWNMKTPTLFQTQSGG